VKYMWVLLMAVGFSQGASATSLYNESSYRSLTGSSVAYAAGDMVTVLVSESASASASSNSNSDTGSSIGMTAADGSNRLEGNLGMQADFNGGGAVKRSGRIIAQVSAMVMHVEQGLLSIQGEKNIVLNDETQTIRVVGLIRPDDISADNTIHSSRIANASIEFLGEGILSASERPGWITRFFQWLF